MTPVVTGRRDLEAPGKAVLFCMKMTKTDISLVFSRDLRKDRA